MRKEEKRSPDGLLFYFSMKVLLLRMGDSPRSRDVIDDTYVRIVNEIKTNAVAMIPPFVKDTEVVDIDAVAVAYANDGQIRFSQFFNSLEAKGETNV